MPAMSKLEAVNEMLLAIGQAPVNTLNVAGIRDVSVAQTILDNVSREVQSEGHSFNTFTMEFTPNSNGFILIGPDYLAVDADDASRNVDPVVDPDDSVLKLYDHDEESFVFPEKIKVRVLKLLAFEAMPQHARRYIVALAKLRFQASVVGSSMLNNLIEQEVGQAYASFRRSELHQQDNNILRQYGIISRNRHRQRRY